MIINGGSRRARVFWAKHLQNEATNERVSVIEFRGLMHTNIDDALREMEAVAQGTRCENFLYHANINPRADEVLTPEQWRTAVDRLEKNLGYEDLPRFVVEHEKDGRIHQHVIWSRIDPDLMIARSDSLNYQKHERTSRELEIAFDLARGKSILTPDREGERPERGAESWEVFRGAQSGITPEFVAGKVRELYAQADSGLAFAHSLDEADFLLCRGDQRVYCMLDQAGEVHSLGRRLGVKAKPLRDFMQDVALSSLPSVDEARDQWEARAQERERERSESESMGRIVADDYVDRDAQDQAWYDNIVRGAIEHAKEEDATRAAMQRAIREMEKARSRTLRLEEQEPRAAEQTTGRNARREAYRIDRDLTTNLALKIVEADHRDTVHELADDRHMRFAHEDGKLYAVTARYKFEYDPHMQDHLRHIFGGQVEDLPTIKDAKRAAFISERNGAIRESTRAAYEQCINDDDHGTGFAENLTKRSLTLERDQWHTLYVSDGKWHIPLEQLVNAGEQRDHLEALHEPGGVFPLIELYEAKRRYWSVAEREAMEANKQRAVTVADAVLGIEEMGDLTALQRQHRAAFGVNDKGLLAVVTDRARVDLDREQSDHIRELMGQPEAMPTLQGARRMAVQLERDHGMTQVLTEGLTQSLQAHDQGAQLLETLAEHHWHLQRDHGERLYVSDGQWQTQLDLLVTPEQQGEALQLISAHYENIPVFDSALDRQERFEQRSEDIAAARLQRLLARDVENVVAKPLTQAVKRTGHALETAADIGGSVVGGALSGAMRIAEPLLGALTDFITGGSSAQLAEARHEAPPPRRDEPVERSQERDMLRRLRPEEAVREPRVQEKVRTGQASDMPVAVQEMLRRRVEAMEAQRRERERDEQQRGLLGRDRDRQRER